MDLDYPQPGFHFLVVFELLPQFPNDVRFQEVTGLTVSTEFEAWPEGGENRFEQCPDREPAREHEVDPRDSTRHPRELQDRVGARLIDHSISV